MLKVLLISVSGSFSKNFLKGLQKETIMCSARKTIKEMQSLIDLHKVLIGFFSETFSKYLLLALYKRDNDQLLWSSSLYKAIYKQNS